MMYGMAGPKYGFAGMMYAGRRAVYGLGQKMGPERRSEVRPSGRNDVRHFGRKGRMMYGLLAN
jgi:hypothetical protein